MFTVTNPVSVAADVEVNRAVIKGVKSLLLFATGSQRNKVPKDIINPKRYIISNGDSNRLDLVELLIDLSSISSVSNSFVLGFLTTLSPILVMLFLCINSPIVGYCKTRF